MLYQDKVTLHDLLGVSVKKIMSGTELLFCVALHKYAQELLGKSLILENLNIIKQVQESEYFTCAYTAGLEMPCEPIATEFLPPIVSPDSLFFESDLSGVVFESKTDAEWVYCFTADRSANFVLNKANRSIGYIYLYAYMVVQAYRDSVIVPKLILKNGAQKQEELEYVDILILRDCGNCLLQDKVEVIYAVDVPIQPEWEAYVTYNRQIGRMSRPYTISEKMKYFTKYYAVGDVVLYYTTNKSILSKTIRKLTGCHPAVIREITNNSIKLEYYTTIETKLTHSSLLDKALSALEDQTLFTREDYERFLSCTITADALSLGIDHLMYTEDAFILGVLNGTDYTEQYIEDSKGNIGIYRLNTVDTIYAVFEDRGISYNKTNFLAVYYKNKTPLYDKIRASKSIKTSKSLGMIEPEDLVTSFEADTDYIDMVVEDFNASSKPIETIKLTGGVKEKRTKDTEVVTKKAKAVSKTKPAKKTAKKSTLAESTQTKKTSTRTKKSTSDSKKGTKTTSSSTLTTKKDISSTKGKK